MIQYSMIEPSVYRLGDLLVGKPIPLPPTPKLSLTSAPVEWSLQPGTYTPRQLVHSFSPLLNTVLHLLGPDPPASRPARTLLLENLAANLATDTREASLPLGPDIGDPSRREMRTQAHRISQNLLRWAQESTGPTSPFHPQLHLELRAPCEAHLLQPPNVALLFGPRGSPRILNLVHEYTHQMLLLRDALLPFQNFVDVLLPVPCPPPDTPVPRGISHIEPPRKQFLATLLAKPVSQAAVVRFARAVLAPSLPKTGSQGYAFQYAHGLILPALFAAGPPPLHLLLYLPASICPTTPAATPATPLLPPPPPPPPAPVSDSNREETTGSPEILFQYEHADYFLAPRVVITPPPTAEIPQPTTFPTGGTPRLQSARLAMRETTLPCDRLAHLDLHLVFENGVAVDVDVGQIARGFRYVYPAVPAIPAVPGAVGAVGGVGAAGAVGSVSPSISTNVGGNPPRCVVHSAYEILTGPRGGLVTAGQEGVHVIPAQERMVALAVLGRLYPENVVGLPREQGLERTVGAGRGFGPKFVVWG